MPPAAADRAVRAASTFAAAHPRRALGPSRRTLARLADRLPAPTGTGETAASRRDLPPTTTGPLRTRLAQVARLLERPDWGAAIDPASAVDGAPAPAGTVRRAEFLGTASATFHTVAEPATATSDRVRELETVERSRGALTHDEWHELVDRLRDRVRSRPHDHALRTRLTHRLVSTGEFDDALDVACGPTPDGGLAAFVEIVRLDTVGRHRDAHRLKVDLATSIADRRPAWHAPLREYVRWIQATRYASSPDDALGRLEERWPTPATRHERRVRAKLSADLQLWSGIPAEHRHDRSSFPTATVTAEADFRRLIRGARVLVIGPSTTERPTPEDVEQSDVIVTTRRRATAGAPGARPVVTYVADSSAVLDRTGLLTTLDQHREDLLVLRPSILSAPSASCPTHARVRVMQTEDATTFLGTQYAVPRIVYDLLAHEPCSIELRGVDFFLAPTSYIAGYQQDASDVRRPDDLLIPHVPHSHDLVEAFRFVQSMSRAGLVSARGRVARILDGDVEHYLQLLELRSPIHLPAAATA